MRYDGGVERARRKEQGVNAADGECVCRWSRRAALAVAKHRRAGAVRQVVHEEAAQCSRRGVCRAQRTAR